MKKLLVIPGLLLLSALLPCGETHCATTQPEKKPVKPVKVEKTTTKKSGKWNQWRKQSITLDTQGGMHKDLKCMYKEPTDKKGGMVFCKRAIKNIGVQKSSPTGTPPHLMYENYIGSFVKQPGKPGLMGSGERIILCDGPCKEIDKEKVKVIA
jgi:hypothetical protein